jgi:PII-like signaling protein
MPQPSLQSDSAPHSSKAKILRLHFCENDKYNGKPLREAIIAKCRDMKIAGATVFRGLEGFGEAAEIHRHHLVTHDQPIVIVIIDSAENIERLKPVVEDMIHTGVTAVSNAEVTRIQRSGPAEHV